MSCPTVPGLVHDVAGAPGHLLQGVAGHISGRGGQQRGPEDGGQVGDGHLVLTHISGHSGRDREMDREINRVVFFNKEVISYHLNI